jgi:hypothetical protein
VIRVFLSSTAKDLSECRAYTYRAIEGLEGYHCVRMEDFGAWDETPEELCRRRVASCDLFVILAGPLYGSIGAAGISYTEEEYDTARKASKPCLIFLTTDDFLIPASAAESVTARRKQDALRKRLAGFVRASFSNCTELPEKVLQAISNWEAVPAEHSIIRIRRDDSRPDYREFRRPFLRFGRNPEIEVPILGDPDVSWEHGMAFKHDGQFYYRHLSRTNNTWLTSQLRSIMLRPGDQQEVPLSAQTQLRMGNTTLQIEIALAAEQRKVVPTNKQDE